MGFLKNNIAYIISFLFLTSLFFGGKVLVLNLLILFGFFFYNIFLNKLHFTKNISLLILVFFYLLHFISIFYSNNKTVAYFDLEVKMALIILPILFLFSKKEILGNKDVVLKLFSYSGFVVTVVLLTNYIANYFTNSTFLTYTSFSIFLHPTYFAIYLGLVIISSIYLFLKNSKFKLANFNLIIIALSLLNIYLSGSKSGIIATFIILLYIFINFGFKKNKILVAIFIFFFIITSVLVLKFNPRFITSEKTLSSYKNVLKSPELENSSTSLRILAWNATIEVIKENAIFGVGAGDVKDELIKKYEELNYVYLVKYKLNSHNQFLETWLGQGLVGFILLLLLFIVPFISAVKNGDIVLQSFLILVFINFLFESMLNTQAGTIFFAFFYSFLVSTSEKQSAEKVL